MNKTKAQTPGRSSITILLLGFAFVSLSLSSAPADPGPANFQFTGTTAPIFDLTGNYRFDQELVPAGKVPIKLSAYFALTQDASGRLQGSGQTVVRIGTDYCPTDYTLSGRINGGGGKKTTATIAVRFRGLENAFSLSAQYSLDVTAAGLKGTVVGSAKVPSLGNGRIKSEIAGVPLPPGIDGSWSVRMDVLPLDRLYGSGAIVLPNGRSLRTTLAGTAAAAAGRLNQIKLTGTDADKGTTLNLSYVEPGHSVQKLSGRILGQNVAGAPAAAQFIGSQACVECHGPIQQTVLNTPHAQFNVQCESCHGPAAEHAANSYDPLVRPKVDQTSATCGTCHSGPQHPTYEEWSSSRHAALALDFNAPNRINTCAICHSGSKRINLLDGVPLPAVAGANVPITCPTCHTPHQNTPYPFQLRNPLSSTNDFFINMSVAFTNQYDSTINLCAQCHNHRAASWTNSASAPHHSPQYNILLGTIGELPGGPVTNRPASHAGFPESAEFSFSGTYYLTNQCASCHMQPDTAPAQTASHTFTVDRFETCQNCHPIDGGLMIEFLAVPSVSNRVYQLKYGLDLWAATKAPPALQAPGVLAWEYTRPGGLTWQTNNGIVSWVVAGQVSFVGPNAAGQQLIPVTIQKARFNLYLVLGDNSFGVHNPFLVTDLLEAALGWVNGELNQ